MELVSLKVKFVSADEFDLLLGPSLRIHFGFRTLFLGLVQFHIIYIMTRRKKFRGSKRILTEVNLYGSMNDIPINNEFLKHTNQIEQAIIDWFVQCWEKSS